MAIYLLKKSYQRKDLKKVVFNDLWNSHGIFTTMWIFKNPHRILFFNKHIDNLIQSLKDYNLYETNIKKNIIKIIKLNLKKKIKYNHLLRIAVNKKLISISLRKRIKPKTNFELKLIHYKRRNPVYKNLKYKKILNYLSKVNISICDIGLCVDNKILESATSNILFVKGSKIYSPVNKFYKGINLKFIEKKVKKIFKKNIFIKYLHTFDEVILIGSGKGVVSVKRIEKYNWNRKSSKTYRYLLKIYQEAVTNCPRYYS
jgi:branched-subunit amino acid aminotransferase/4-amino-4-deoxychorismate lyase